MQKYNNYELLIIKSELLDVTLYNKTNEIYTNNIEIYLINIFSKKTLLSFML